MKVLANDGISPSGKTAIENAGFIISTQTIAQDQLADEINSKGYDVVLVRSATTVRKELIDACPNLKMIGRGGVGMDNIDVEYARSKGIVVFNTPASSSQSVAEMVMAHLFGMVRSLYDSNRQMPISGQKEFKTLKKKYGKGIELRGKTLGIIGFGRIGQALAEYALGCGMNVIAHDTHGSNIFPINVSIADQTVKINVHNTSFENLIQTADIISLHVPGGKEAVIGEKEFNQMKTGVAIVNAARGGVIDEAALIAALNSGKVAHAGLDVFVNEPSPSQEILSHPSISLSPHIGAATEEAQDRIGTELAEIIIKFHKDNLA